MQGHNILHLCFDGNFINKSSTIFEHFYPGRNIFCIIRRSSIKGQMLNVENAIWLDSVHPEPALLERICEEKQVGTILMHGLHPNYSKALPLLSANHTRRIYWIFHGYELYYALGEKGLWKLVDNESIFSIDSWISPTRYNYYLRKFTGQKIYYDHLVEALPWIDYFCFWLYEDYLLLKEHFSTNIAFKHFQYSAYFQTYKDVPEPLEVQKTAKEIRINHSASKTGNHDTIMNLLHKIDAKNEFRKVVPLSYGSKYMRKQISKMGYRLFGQQFVPELDYVSLEEYRATLRKVGVAIFGHCRQEASGNIVALLRSGAKVFLRERNFLLKHYRDLGFIVFSVEKDLKTIDDLQPLTVEQMQHNAEVAVKSRVFYEDFMPQLLD